MKKVENKILTCKRCQAKFESDSELQYHRQYQHGEYVVNDCFRNGIKKITKHKPFNPHTILKQYRNKVSDILRFPEPYTINDEAIPECDRIYSPNKTFWCRKTSKESAEKCFSSIEQMNKRLETRRTDYIEPDVKDLVHIGKMGILGNDRRINVYYIWDTNNKEYRIFTDEVKSKNNLNEVIYNKNKDKGCYVVKGVDKKQESEDSLVRYTL
ncbi:MAG: hypothetical protein NT038_07930 [Euryarchaeota archaeon]|nr:hypothetical protein [Euryarchaeota archaeon]